MKTKIFSTLLLTPINTGCQKQPNQSAITSSTTDPVLKGQIDNLMKIVEESMTAYKACKSRVDAVQQALNETFKE